MRVDETLQQHMMREVEVGRWNWTCIHILVFYSLLTSHSALQHLSHSLINTHFTH